MIHRTSAAVHSQSSLATEQPNWQQQLANAITDPAELLTRLKLPLSLLDGALNAAKAFPLRVPEPYLARIRPGDPEDPLLLQVLPQSQELQPTPGYVTDPLGEEAANPLQGLIHKYQGRVLLIISGGCAINCRYCFRRHFPYEENQLGQQQWQALLDYLNSDPSIEEVIFSGGDPLATSDQRLLRMIDDLEQIPHLRRLRIHTRLPVVIPDRLTTALLERLERSRLQTVMVVHINHPNELDQALNEALQRARTAGITLLNQSVLLRNINNDLASLKRLSECLFEAGVLPYYLHLLDPVEGAAHFDMDETSARQLVGLLATQLSGYLIPKLVREQAGAPAKVTLLPEFSDSE